MILQLASYNAAEYPLPMEVVFQSLPHHFSGSVETHIPDRPMALIHFPLPFE